MAKPRSRHPKAGDEGNETEMLSVRIAKALNQRLRRHKNEQENELGRRLPMQQLVAQILDDYLKKRGA